MNEAERNRVLRRADWRFLLPDPAPVRVLCLAGADLRAACAAIAQRVDDVPADGAAYDLVVAENPDDATVRRAATLMAPAAACYTEWSGLAATRAGAVRASLERAGLQVVQVGPYGKRFDVALSGGGGALFTVIASRAGQAAEVAAAERDRSAAGTRRAGLALGYPPCCVERFVELERSDAARTDGINEAALRAVWGGAGAMRWQLNPLSLLSPIGFVPCRADCAAALAWAERVLEAAARVEPGAAATIREVLARPILFFRHPLFFVLAEAATDGDVVRYRRAFANDDGSGIPAALAAWLEDELGAPLALGDELRLDGATLRVARGGAAIAEWQLTRPTVPLLLRFDE